MPVDNMSKLEETMKHAMANLIEIDILLGLLGDQNMFFSDNGHRWAIRKADSHSVDLFGKQSRRQI
tara:strand:+ start:321 stop:518 length:198 start_codon:yes stop_codon:yes gene_type:complete